MLTNGVRLIGITRHGIYLPPGTSHSGSRQLHVILWYFLEIVASSNKEANRSPKPDAKGDPQYLLLVGSAIVPRIHFVLQRVGKVNLALFDLGPGGRKHGFWQPHRLEEGDR